VASAASIAMSMIMVVVGKVVGVSGHGGCVEVRPLDNL
jgi:hypothetical protein